jgi:glycosyltransferase 2 family protein
VEPSTNMPREEGTLQISNAEVTTKFFSSVAATQRRGSATPGGLLVFKLVLGILLLGTLLWQSNLTRVSELLLRADGHKMALSVLALSMGVIINAHRWRLITRIIGHPISLRDSIIGYFESMLFNQILPTGIGGDASRVLRAVNSGLRYTWAIISVLIDRSIGLWMVAFCVVMGFLFSGSSIIGASSFIVAASTSSLILAGSIVAAIGGALIRATSVPGWATAIVTLMNSFCKCVTSSAVAMLFFDLVLSTFLTTMSFRLCAQAVAVPIGWWEALMIMQSMTLASVLPVSIGGWGVREGAAVLLFAPLGVGPAQALAISILFGLAMTVLGVIGAVVWISSGHHRSIRFLNQQPRQS